MNMNISNGGLPPDCPRQSAFSRAVNSIRTRFSLAAAAFRLVLLALFYVGGRVVLVHLVRDAEEQVKDLLEGRKIFVEGLTSKNGSTYDAYLTPKGKNQVSGWTRNISLSQANTIPIWKSSSWINWEQSLHRQKIATRPSAKPCSLTK